MKLIILFLFIFTANLAHGQQLQLINWFAGADVVGVANDPATDLESDFYVREFEYSAFASIDQTWDGVLTLAYHQQLEEDGSHIEVHEAFITSSKVFDLTQLRIGKMFMGFGRLNRFHRHDWVFTDAPMVQKAFFGNEGAKDTGIEMTRILPSLSSRWSLGVMSGNEFNHTGEHDHEADASGEETHGKLEKAKSPTVYTRFAHFVEFNTSRGMDYGFNAINRVDKEANRYQYGGLDFTFKDRIGRYLNWLIQAEYWALNKIHVHDGEETTEEHNGYYIYFQKGFDQHHAVGLRLDEFTVDPHTAQAGHEMIIDGLHVEDKINLVSLSYIYSNSEFMKTKFTVDHVQGAHFEDDPDRESFTRGFIQFTFNIGAHPAHYF